MVISSAIVIVIVIVIVVMDIAIYDFYSHRVKNRGVTAHNVTKDNYK